MKTEVDGIVVARGRRGWKGSGALTSVDSLHRQKGPISSNGGDQSECTLFLLANGCDLLCTLLVPCGFRTLLIDELGLVSVDTKRSRDGMVTNNVRFTKKCLG